MAIWECVLRMSGTAAVPSVASGTGEGGPRLLSGSCERRDVAHAELGRLIWPCSCAPGLPDVRPVLGCEGCGARCSWRAGAWRWSADRLPARQGQQDRQRLAAEEATADFEVLGKVFDLEDRFRLGLSRSGDCRGRTRKGRCHQPTCPISDSIKISWSWAWTSRACSPLGPVGNQQAVLCPGAVSTNGGISSHFA